MPHCPKEKLPPYVFEYESSWEQFEDEPIRQAIELWGRKFGEVDVNPGNSMTYYTGIGEVLADPRLTQEKIYEDGSAVARFVDMGQFERSQTLFMVGSPWDSRHLDAYNGLVRLYKQMFGVERVVGILTSLAHERQDGYFEDEHGRFMHEVDMLDYSVWSLAQSGVDGLVVVQPHSVEVVKKGLRRGLPVLPLDATKFLVWSTGLAGDKSVKLFSPDEGRSACVDRLAIDFEMDKYTTRKKREKSKKGKPRVKIKKKQMKRLMQNGEKALMVEDEIRGGGTVVNSAKKMGKVGVEMYVVAVKGYFAGKAVRKIGKRENILGIWVTDAVKPRTNVGPLLMAGKLHVVSLMDEVRAVVGLFQEQMVPGGEERWLRDTGYSGTMLRLEEDEGC